MTQRYSSARTSRKQVPALHRKVSSFEDGVRGHRVLDYGCGKYENGMSFLDDQGAEVVTGLDPYNRDDRYNRETREIVAMWGGADTILCANVLNVIDSAEARVAVLRDCIAMLNPYHGRLFVSVYVGDRSGIGRETRDGWQNNRTPAEYRRDLSVALGPDSNALVEWNSAVQAFEVTV